MDVENIAKSIFPSKKKKAPKKSEEKSTDEE
jgi:hypothetical protein